MDNQTSNQSLLYGIIGLLLGIVLTVVVINNQMYGMMRYMGMGNASTMMQRGMMDEGSNGMMGMSMMDMNDELKNKTGDDFDKAFIAEMITHHQGAIDMANEAKKSAKHEEIKKLADDIVTAQTKEIDIMKSWYKNWYGTDVPSENVNSDNMMR